jgi:hypothetical protein
MAEKRKCDNNGNSSRDNKRARKTHSFETKLDILKHTDSGEGHGEITRSLGLSCSTVSITVKIQLKLWNVRKCR